MAYLAPQLSRVGAAAATVTTPCAWTEHAVQARCACTPQRHGTCTNSTPATIPITCIQPSYQPQALTATADLNGGRKVQHLLSVLTSIGSARVPAK